MTELLIGLLATNTLTIAAFLWMLRDQANSHRAEVASLHEARVHEVANLCQRIQAPEQAVVSHIADNAPPNPPSVNLENDEEMAALAEQRMRETFEWIESRG